MSLTSTISKFTTIIIQYREVPNLLAQTLQVKLHQILRTKFLISAFDGTTYRIIKKVEIKSHKINNINTIQK